MQQLSISQRPRTFSRVIGQSKILNTLQKFASKDRLPSAYLLTGERGSGKTSIAQIMSVAFNCPHQDVDAWGNPCKKCRRNKAAFPIFEVNAGETTGKDDIQKLLENAQYEVMNPKHKRVYFFDEVHAISAASELLLLKYLEDESQQNVWILGTTRPDLLDDTLTSRCQLFEMRPFGNEEATELVTRLLNKFKSELDPDALVEALMEKNVTSPRLIVQAVDRYMIVENADDAVILAGMNDATTKKLCRRLTKGDWPDVVAILNKLSNANARGIRVAVVGYLKTMLLDSPEIDMRSKAIGRAIKRLAYVGQAESLVQMAALTAELQDICELMRKYQ